MSRFAAGTSWNSSVADGESQPAGARVMPNATPEVTAQLSAPLSNNFGVRLEVIEEHHRELLRVACAQDLEIWDIYPFSMIGAHFDPAFAAMRNASHRIALAAYLGDEVVGTTSYLAIDPANHVLEIGGTYFAPKVRGTGFNLDVKRLMIDRAITAGFTRIEFRADARNVRSCAAIAKLGATREGVLRKNRITWTGHVRDTVVFSLLANEWSAF
jgi:RimJ/RimL family protein N-acetyltransferase